MSSFLPLYGQALICMAALAAESSDDEDEMFSSSEDEDEHEENDDPDEDEDEDEEYDGGDVDSDSNHVQEEEQDEGEGQEEAGCDGESSSEEENDVEAEEEVGHNGAEPAEGGEESDGDDSSLDGSAGKSDSEEDDANLDILEPLALLKAAETDKPGAIRRLLHDAESRDTDDGHYIIGQDDEGRTALHIAVIHDHSKCVSILLEWNKDPDLPVDALEVADDQDCTPLLLAVQYEAEDIALMLLEYGADVNTVMYEGDNPYEVAAARGNKRLLRLLIRFGARPKDADSDWKPPRLESENDNYDVFGFHPCGITRRGMQQKLEEQVAVTGKEQKRQQSAQRTQEEEEGNSADDDDAHGEQSSDGGYDECDDIGQKHAIKAACITGRVVQAQETQWSLLNNNMSLDANCHVKTLSCSVSRLTNQTSRRQQL